MSHAIRFIHQVFRLCSIVDHIHDEEGEEYRKPELGRASAPRPRRDTDQPFLHPVSSFTSRPFSSPASNSGGARISIEGTEWAYVLRRGIVEIIPMTIYLLHGRLSMEVATDLMRENEMQIETFAEYRESCDGMVEQSESA